MNYLPELIAMLLVSIYIIKSIKAYRREVRLKSVSNAVRTWELIKQDRARTRAGVYRARN